MIGKNKTKASTKKKHDFWFNPKGIIQNFKSIHWTPLKSKKDGTDGVLKKYVKVLTFMISFAILFVGIDAIVSVAMKGAGFF